MESDISLSALRVSCEKFALVQAERSEVRYPANSRPTTRTFWTTASRSGKPTIRRAAESWDASITGHPARGLPPRRPGRCRRRLRRSARHVGTKSRRAFSVRPDADQCIAGCPSPVPLSRGTSRGTTAGQSRDNRGTNAGQSRDKLCYGSSAGRRWATIPRTFGIEAVSRAWA